jgi:site-specific DNA recombinase
VIFKDETLPGEQPAIVSRELFDAVQAKLAEQLNNHIRTRFSSEALLIGKIYDDRGNRMSPSHARKKGVRYRYYVSLPLLQGQPQRAGSIHRAPAAEIETLVANAVRREIHVGPDVKNRDLLATYVIRVEVQSKALVIQFVATKTRRAAGRSGKPKIIRIPWQKPPSKRRREIIAPPSITAKDPRPIRADARAKLVAAISRGRRWVNELITGTVASIEEIAARDRCSTRKVNMTISLAFLAPGIVKAAIEGRLPRGMGMSRLCDPPAEWTAQYREFGLTPP